MARSAAALKLSVEMLERLAGKEVREAYLQQKAKRPKKESQSEDAEYAAFLQHTAEQLDRIVKWYLSFGENKTPVYTGRTMGDAEHDLNALAAKLGYTSFEEAAVVLTAGKKPARALSSDPLSVARRIVRRYERRKDKGGKPSREVLDAFGVINRATYKPKKLAT